MFVVVTGGSGFLGSHVVEALARRGHEVAVFDVAAPPQEILANPTCRFIAGDLSSLDSLERALAGADAVCHLGGVGDVYLAAREPQTAALLNVTGSANVAEAALRQGVGKVVYASTWEVYGEPEHQPITEAHPCRPDHPYNITKYGGELMLLSYDELKGLPVLALRLGTAFGLRMRPNSVFSIFIRKGIDKEPIVIQGTGEQGRQFTHATDIAQAFAMGVESDVHGLALNIVSPELVSIRQLAEQIQRRLPTEVSFGPARPGDIAPAVVSAQKAADLLQWTARVPFDQGLDEMIRASTEALVNR